MISNQSLLWSQRKRFSNKFIFELQLKHKCHVKCQALSNVAAIIANGAERMRSSQSEASRTRSTDFHSELFNMRQNWRLRKKENMILGDLSYKSGIHFNFQTNPLKLISLTFF